MLKFIICLLMMLVLPTRVMAADFETTQIRLACALASMAAYNDDTGLFARDMLNSQGWIISSVKDYENSTDAKAIFITRQVTDDRTIKILAVTGTDDIKDVETDFKIMKVALDGSASDSMVHKGFNDYTNELLEHQFVKDVIDELQKPNEHLYLTGHSLGGAVAVLTAAKLSDLGIGKDKVDVITFGAPEVGNRAFANEYADKINLTRIILKKDPINKALRRLGYVHFGDVVNYKPLGKYEKFPHNMTLYLDCAIRDYYDVKEFNLPAADESVQDKIYVAPLQVEKGSVSNANLKYVKAAIYDNLTLKMPRVVFGGLNIDEALTIDKLNWQAKISKNIKLNIDNDLIEAAKAADCKFVMLQYLQIKKIRDDRLGNLRISIEELICDLNGFPVSMQTSSTTTIDFTILEAIILLQENLHADLKNLLSENKMTAGISD